VVLTSRDADRWYQCAEETIYVIGQAPPKWARWLIPLIRKKEEMVNGTIWMPIFQGRFNDEVYAKQVFTD